MPFERTFSGAPWESQVGYCRALKAGGHICVSGSAPVDSAGQTVAPGDAYTQARRCFEIIDESLEALGADRSQVVRTRMFVTDIKRWAEFGQAHKEFYGNHPPATSMVEVKALIDPAMLIEVEAEAITSAVQHSN